MAIMCNKRYSVGVWWEVCRQRWSKCWKNFALSIKRSVCMLHIAHCTWCVAQCTHVSSRAKPEYVNKIPTLHTVVALFTLNLLYVFPYSLALSLLFSTLFHFVWQLSMQCNSDFSKGGSMVEIGGVP